MLIERAEAETYREMWQFDLYHRHSPGLACLDRFKDMAHPDRSQTVLDAGCGTGQAALALWADGYAVTLCDLTDTGLTSEAKRLPFLQGCLWHDHRQTWGRFDWVYCADVLEHLPPQFTMLAITRLLELARRGLFLSIALEPDAFGAWVGKPLHQTVQPFTWWRDALGELGPVVEARDCLAAGLYLMKDRP